MKKTSSLAFLGLLLLTGAGCAKQKPVATVPTTSDLAYATDTYVADAASSTVTTPPPVASTTTASSTNPVSTPEPVKKPAMTELKFPGILPAAEVNKNVRIKTTLGDIVIQVSSEMGPRAASNFVYLVKEGFYNGTIFHRVIPEFMIQGGDPTGTGMGGPGYQFDNDKVNVGYTDGIVAMANAGRNTNGSQFFIMVADVPLPPDYSVFGKVTQGLDVAHKIADVPRNGADRPNTEVKMISVTIE